MYFPNRVGRERSTSTVTQEEEFCARFILIKITSSQGKLFLLISYNSVKALRLHLKTRDISLGISNKKPFANSKIWASPRTHIV